MNPAFRFARGGKVYKELEADEAHEIPGFIRTGIISPNDDYWTPGMGDWKKVSSGVWNHPAPVTGAANKPPTIQAAEAAQAAASLGSSVTPIVGRSLNCECTTCKKGFNTPAKAVSGYSVIGKAAVFFLIGVGLMTLVYAMRDVVTASIVDSDHKKTSPLLSLVPGLIAFASLVFFLMSAFELIAAAVTHGIYRANPECCPHCKSTTFLRRMPPSS